MRREFLICEWSGDLAHPVLEYIFILYIFLFQFVIAIITPKVAILMLPFSKQVEILAGEYVMAVNITQWEYTVKCVNHIIIWIRPEESKIQTLVYVSILFINCQGCRR